MRSIALIFYTDVAAQYVREVSFQSIFNTVRNVNIFVGKAFHISWGIPLIGAAVFNWVFILSQSAPVIEPTSVPADTENASIRQDTIATGAHEKRCGLERNRLYCEGCANKIVILL